MRKRGEAIEVTKSVLTKIIALFLLISLAFGNFAFVIKTYAFSLSDFFGSSNTSSQTGHENVEFDAYFKNEDEQGLSALVDINDNDANVEFEINVNDVGYLKDASIEILQEDGNKTNFDISNTDEYKDYIDTIEDNKISLKQINATSNVKLSIPLKYKNEKYIREDKIDSVTIAKFSGIYVDKNGNQYIVSKEYPLNLKWICDRKINSSLDITKYIDFGSGVIVQGIIKVNNEVDNTSPNVLPVKSTEITVKVPNFMDKEVNNVSVSANKLEATNGQNVENVKFSDDNWSFDKETKELKIELQNEKKSMVYVEDENTLLDEENRNEEERIDNIPGEDEYLITFTYLDVKAQEEGVKIENNIKVKQEYYSASENSSAVANIEGELELKEQEGNLVSLKGIEETEKISKAYGYLNYLNESKIEKEIISNDLINISNKDIIESIKVKDSETKYTFGENEENTSDVYYKKIILSRKNINDILGEEGSIEIYDLNGAILETINKDTEDEDGNIEVNLEGHRVVDIKISKPVKSDKRK